MTTLYGGVSASDLPRSSGGSGNTGLIGGIAQTLLAAGADALSASRTPATSTTIPGTTVAVPTPTTPYVNPFDPSVTHPNGTTLSGGVSTTPTQSQSSGTGGQSQDQTITVNTPAPAPAQIQVPTLPSPTMTPLQFNSQAPTVGNPLPPHQTAVAPLPSNSSPSPVALSGGVQQTAPGQFQSNQATGFQQSGGAGPEVADNSTGVDPAVFGSKYAAPDAGAPQNLAAGVTQPMGYPGVPAMGPQIPGSMPQPPGMPDLPPIPPMPVSQAGPSPFSDTMPQFPNGNMSPAQREQMPDWRKKRLAMLQAEIQQAEQYLHQRYPFGSPDLQYLTAIEQFANQRKQAMAAHPILSGMGATARYLAGVTRTTDNARVLDATIQQKADYMAQHPSVQEQDYRAVQKRLDEANKEYDSIYKDHQAHLDALAKEQRDNEHMTPSEFREMFKQLGGIPDGPQKDELLTRMVDAGVLQYNKPLLDALRHSYNEAEALKGRFDLIAKGQTITNAALNTQIKKQLIARNDALDGLRVQTAKTNLRLKALDEQIKAAKAQNAPAKEQLQLERLRNQAYRAATQDQRTLLSAAAVTFRSAQGEERELVKLLSNPLMRVDPAQEDHIKQSLEFARQQMEAAKQIMGGSAIGAPQPSAPLQNSAPPKPMAAPQKAQPQRIAPPGVPQAAMDYYMQHRKEPGLRAAFAKKYKVDPEAAQGG